MSGAAVVVLVALAVGAALAAVFASLKAKRAREAREVAAQLVPEIRAILDDSEARAGETPRYHQSRSRLPRVLSPEALFAVETFYQSAEALVRASATMAEAFGGGQDTSLGDRIRAKDLRDRCMKDVYYSGEAAIQKLESA